VKNKGSCANYYLKRKRLDFVDENSMEVSDPWGARVPAASLLTAHRKTGDT
jgi:hypothetical protein